jgi:hypothetical protein
MGRRPRNAEGENPLTAEQQGRNLKLFLHRHFPGQSPRDIHESHPQVIPGTLYAVLAGRRSASRQLLALYERELGVPPRWVTHGIDSSMQLYERMLDDDADDERWAAEGRASLAAFNAKRRQRAQTGSASTLDLVSMPPDESQRLAEELRLLELFRSATPDLRRFVLAGLENVVNNPSYR